MVIQEGTEQEKIAPRADDAYIVHPAAVSPEYFCRESVGIVRHDPGRDTKYYDEGWAILQCDQGIVDFYVWLCRRWGKPVQKNALWKAHVSFIKGEIGTSWGLYEAATVQFRYSNIVRWDNNFHAWLDVWCPQLHQIRKDYGLSERTKMSFHMTLGRLE